MCIGELSMQHKIESLIENFVTRGGSEELMNYLEVAGFYTAPASTKHHHAYKGGLAEHSYQVYEKLLELNDGLNLGYDMETMVIVALMHDLCKIDQYKFNNETIKWNRDVFDRGHGQKSIRLLKQFIDLKDYEEDAIMYHMGAYEKSEYSWNELSIAYRKHSLSYYMHVADMKSTYEF